MSTSDNYRWMWILCVLSCAIAAGNESWNRPGCHLVPSTITNNDIPYCAGILLPANACRGYCESYSIATDPEDIKGNPNQVITSTSSCCDMDEIESIVVPVPCLMGFKNHTFSSAKSCKCGHCV